MKALVVATEDRGRRIAKELLRQRIDSKHYTSLSGIREIGKEPVDIVVADIEMPGISGEAAIRKLKDVKHDTPLVFISAKAPAAIKEFLEPGVFFCSFEDLKGRNLNRLLSDMIATIENTKHAASRAPRMDVPLARHVLLELHDPETGRLDAKRIAGYLQISLSSLAAVTGRSVAAIHKAPAADSLQQPLAPVARTISVLSEILQSKVHVRAWLRTPHPDLDNQIPMRMIQEGQAGAVADMLESALAGQPA